MSLLFAYLQGKMGICSDPDYEQFSVPTSADDRTPACILGESLQGLRL